MSTKSTQPLDHLGTDDLITRLKNTPESGKPELVSILELRTLSPSQLFEFLPFAKDQATIFAKLRDLRDSLTVDQLFWLAPFDPKKSDFLLSIFQRRSELNPNQLIKLFNMHSNLPQEGQVRAIQYLYEQKDVLTQLEMIYLVKCSAWEAPTSFKEVLNKIWEGEVAKKFEHNINLPVVIVLPLGINCTPNYPISHHSSPTSPGRGIPQHSPLHYLSPQKDGHLYYIDLYGHMAPLLGQSVAITLTLAQSLSDPAKAAAIHLSTPPHYDTKNLVGFLSDQSPTFSLGYPFPKIGAVSLVRIEITFCPLQEILSKLKNIKTEIPEFSIGDTKMVVCHGDIHLFDIQKEETIGEFLLRVSRRWNVNPVEFEIQDLNFQTYPENTKFGEYSAKGGSRVVRLVKKQGVVGGGFFQTTPEKKPLVGAGGPFQLPATGNPVSPLFQFNQKPFQFN